MTTTAEETLGTDANLHLSGFGSRLLYTHYYRIAKSLIVHVVCQNKQSKNLRL